MEGLDMDPSTVLTEALTILRPVPGGTRSSLLPSWKRDWRS